MLASPDFDYEWDEKLGANLGAVAGATYFFNQYVGANLEVGAHWHWYKATYEENGDEINFTLKQGLIAANAVFALGQPQR
jgi:hypothetical protein